VQELKAPSYNLDFYIVRLAIDGESIQLIGGEPPCRLMVFRVELYVV
jgi:hypothetical protein